MRAQYVDSVSRSDIARVLVALLVLQLFPNRQYHDADAGVSFNSHEMTPKFRPSGGFCKSLSIQLIFLMANQIPLLDIASPMPLPPEMEGPAEDAPHASSLGEMIGMMHMGRMAMAPERAAAMAAPTVVAFTDPNDLLSYRLLPPVVDLARARLINVIASNAETWLGFLERPDTAHCGYTLNRTVIGLITQGHKVGEPLPEAPVVEANQCL